MMKWRFENTGFNSGQFNMQYDLSLAHALLSDQGAPTVRVYGWKPSAISLGWNQYFEEIDLHKASAAGVDVVRRPTGGRAILHADELTYSVSMVTSRKNVSDVYNEISKALVCGLRFSGVGASLEKSQPDFPTLYRTRSSTACFVSSARHEVKLHGRKLIGSAQRRFVRADGEEVALQHGSILIGPGHKKIVEFLHLENQEDRKLIEKELDEKTIDLETAIGSAITFEEVAAAIRRGFEEAWEIEFKVGDELHQLTKGYYYEKLYQ